MTLLLTVDIGNSYITIAGFDNSDDNSCREMLFKSRLVTERRRTDDQYACELMQLLALNRIDINSIDGNCDSIVCSVVPELTRVICHALRKLSGKMPAVLGPGVKTGLEIILDDPSQLGSDLVADAVAAKKLYGYPCIIFDLGTATTVSVLDSKGRFKGGMICAGIGIQLESLAAKTSLLPHVSLDRPKNVIGRNTAQCMQSGVIFGTAAMIDGIIDRTEKELGERASVVITGSHAKVIAQECKRKINVEDSLLMLGLKEIYMRNK